MISASTGFVAAMAQAAPIQIRVAMTLSDGTTRLELGGERVMQGGVTLTEAVSSASSFDVGAAVIPQLSLSLNNMDGLLDSYDLGGATLSLSVGTVVGNATEWVVRGHYRVNAPDTLGAIAKLSCDGKAMSALALASAPSVASGATLGAIATSACQQAGVTLASAGFANNAYAVAEAVDTSGLSCLELLSYVAMAAGCFVRETPAGEVELAWYDETQAPFAAAYNAAVDVRIYDVEVTGVTATSAQDASGNSESETSGTTGYVLALAPNPLVAYGEAQDVAAQVASQVVGMAFRPFDCSTIGTPLLQAGDRVTVTDSRGVAHGSYVTSLTWKANAYESLSCGAETPNRRATSVTPLVQAVSDVAGRVTRAISIASEAADVANATNQHFFTDANGVHVTETANAPTTGSNILINSLGMLIRTGANYLASLTSSAVAFYDGLGTAASNIVAQLGANLARIGYEAGNHVDITDDGIDFSMPYDDGEGHAGTVNAEMYPEYDSAPAFVIKHGPTILKLLSNLSMSLTGNLLVSDGVEANTASVSNWLQVGTSDTGTIYGQSGVLTVIAASPSVHARTNESNPTNARDVSITATSTKRGLYDNGQNGGWIVYADDNNEAVIGGMRPYASGTSAAAQNYYALINAATGVGIQFIFNPSTLNLAVRYTTNGGTNWSATRTLATWA